MEESIEIYLFLRDLVEERSKGLPGEVKDLMLEDFRERFQEIRNGCDSDEDAKEILRADLG